MVAATGTNWPRDQTTNTTSSHVWLLPCALSRNVSTSRASCGQAPEPAGGLGYAAQPWSTIGRAPKLPQPAAVQSSALAVPRFKHARTLPSRDAFHCHGAPYTANCGAECRGTPCTDRRRGDHHATTAASGVGVGNAGSLTTAGWCRPCANPTCRTEGCGSRQGSRATRAAPGWCKTGGKPAHGSWVACG